MRTYLRRYWKSCTVIALLLFGGCSWGALEYTHNPRFCVSCHVMKPFYEAWQTSSHNMVGCVDCHYPPGIRHELRGKLDAINQVVAFWTGSYNTKFYAEIEDASCMRSGCHDKRLEQGVIEFKRGIKFSHDDHYGSLRRGIMLRCTSCHSQIVQGNHMAVTEFTCFLCHFRGRVNERTALPQRFCLGCHSYPESQLAVGNLSYNHKDFVERGVLCWRCHYDVVQGKGEVEDRACLQCHDDPEQIKRITEIQEVHLNHVTKHKVECFNCHADVTHSVPEQHGPQDVSCAACHSGTHFGPRSLYSGTGGRGVDEMPSAMYTAQVDCIGCHLERVSYGEEHVMRGFTMRPTVEACVDCHGEMGREIFGFWQDSIASQLELTRPVVQEARRAVEAAGLNNVPLDWQKILLDAEHNLEFVEYGKGIHNLNYSIALLEKAREYARDVIRQVR